MKFFDFLKYRFDFNYNKNIEKLKGSYVFNDKKN